ncbi:MAG: hypothetical protein R6V01_00835 [Thermoplasmatota archaeon]
MMVLLVPTAAIAGCLGGEEDDGDGWTITINGMEFEKNEIFQDYETHEVADSKGDTYEGIYLEELLSDAGVDDLSSYTYKLIAADSWTKEVTHLDMEEGILVEEETMTIFPDLPGKYKVKNVVTIEPLPEGDTITVNGQLWTWMQPFDILEESIMYDNESIGYTGVKLSDMINYTSLENPQDHNFTISASDGYSKDVTWDDMMNGLLVDNEDHMTMFPHLTKSYWIKDVVKIQVV